MPRNTDPEDNFRRPPSYMKDAHRSPYEQEQVGAGNIEPAGWVVNSQGNVRVEDDGLHVTDGAIFIEDAFGQNVLTGAGFGATWMDFIDSHVYNNSFRAGSTDDITAATESGGGDTIAEYEDSISDDLPYWVVKSLTVGSNGGYIRRVADSDSVSGYSLEIANDIDVTIYQDIPISPGQRYAVYFNWKRAASPTSEVTTVVGIQFLDRNHASLAIAMEDSIAWDDDQTSYGSRQMVEATSDAPAAARFARISIQIDSAFGGQVNIASLNVDPLTFYGDIRLPDSDVLMANGGAIQWFNSVTQTKKVQLSSTGDTGARLNLFGGAGGAYLEMEEMTAPSAPVMNRGILFLRDNGAGKTQLCILFNTGAVQVIATQP